MENQYALSHGQAVAIGSTYAATISAQLLGFKQTEKVLTVLEQYGLPTNASFNTEKVFAVLQMDKKRERSEMNFILLEKIGKAVILPIPLKDLENIINKL